MSEKHHRMLGKRVFSTGGDELGKVDDVEFDPDTGTITALFLAGGEVAGVRLIGVGSYAVVVQAEEEEFADEARLVYRVRPVRAATERPSPLQTSRRRSSSTWLTSSTRLLAAAARPRTS